jgi:predicted ATPase
VVLENLGPLTVLVGRNAVGKSNILQAIQSLAINATALPSSREPAGGPMLLSCEVAFREKAYRYSYERQVKIPRKRPRREFNVSESLRYSDGRTESRVFERNGESVTISEGDHKTVAAIGESAPCMPALVSLLPADSTTTNLILPFLRYLERIRYYHPLGLDSRSDELSLISQSNYDDWVARQPSDPGNSALMRLLHMALANQEQLAEVRSLLGPDGLGLLSDLAYRKLEGAKSKQTAEASNIFYWFQFQPALQPDAGPEFLEFDNLSTGTQRLIRIVASLIHDKSAVMLLEHPEDGIHRALLRKLIDLLQKYSDQTQLIIASHSSIVFNTLDPSSIRLVTMEEDGTKVRPLTSEELQAAARFLEEEGSLSDFIETVEES